MKTKTKLLFSLLFAFIIFLTLGATNVKATEYEENLIKRIAPDGENATFKTIKPKNDIEFDFILNNLVNVLLNEDGYEASIYNTNNDFSNCEVNICKSGNEENTFNKTYNIKVIYDEPKKNKTIDSILNKIKKFNETKIDSYYQIKDLSLINYYMTSEKSELWQQGSSGRALKYSKEIIDLSDGGDISFYLDVRAGSQGEDLMYEFAFGEMSVFYNDYIYANMPQGIYLTRIIYIPENTEETKEAYINAVQKRINEYLGTDKDVIVTYGGSLDSLEDDCEDKYVQCIPREMTDGNYYNVTIKGRTYRFYIVKGNEKDLVEPTYLGKNIETNIKITTNESNVPLDTHLIVKSVKNDNINKIIKTDNYEAFDIKLFSESNKNWITKLNNGKFLVSIPISEQLNGKSITTYYINSNNELEEHKTTIRDGLATFETDHFSTYILAERVANIKDDEKENNNITEEIKEENKEHKLDDEPKTGIISIVSILSVIIIISMVGIVISKNKMYK